MIKDNFKNFDEADALRLFARLKKENLLEIYQRYTRSVLKHIINEKLLQFEYNESDESGFQFPKQTEIENRICCAMEYLDFIYSEGESSKDYLRINTILSKTERRLLDWMFVFEIRDSAIRKLQEEYRTKILK